MYNYGRSTWFRVSKVYIIQGGFSIPCTNLKATDCGIMIDVLITETK